MQHSKVSDGIAAAAVALLAGQTLAQTCPTCQSFGVDFQNNGGPYYQNSQSTSPFTFTSEFEGCQNDLAYYLLVDPNGNQLECNNTAMTPDDTPEMSTCPIDEDQLFNGEWSILITSNNGNCNPIAQERDFSLTVYPQQTTTYTPTVTGTIVTTPVVNNTVTSTETDTSTLSPSTVTTPSTTIQPTVTSTPKAVTATVTDYIATLHPTKWVVSPSQVTSTKTASCSTKARATTSDPILHIKPTIGAAATIASKVTASAGVRRSPKMPALEFDERERFLRERRERLEAAAGDGLHKRGLEQPTVTVTDTNTADWVTTTSTSTAAASTATITATSTVIVTSTPPPVTVVSGSTVAPPVTVTAPTPTKTKTAYAISTSWVTSTLHPTITITTKITPSATATHCKLVGGVIV